MLQPRTPNEWKWIAYEDATEAVALLVTRKYRAAFYSAMAAIINVAGICISYIERTYLSNKYPDTQNTMLYNVTCDENESHAKIRWMKN
jgi:hypothetical protein